MGMIKRADIEQYTRDAYVMNLSDLEKRGRSVIDAANAEAERIIRQAREERARLISSAEQTGQEQGYKEGYAKGLQEGTARGVEEARASTAEQIAGLESAWSEQLALFEQTRTQMLEQARVQVVELAAQIAKRVIRRSVELDPSLVLNELESVLSSITESTRFVISVHPEDAELIGQELPKMVERFSQCEHAQIVTDPGLERGSCVAKTTGGGVIDASIQTQLDRIIQALLPAEGERTREESIGLPTQDENPDQEQDAA